MDEYTGRHVCKHCVGRASASTPVPTFAQASCVLRIFLCLYRALAQSSEDKGLELLETKPPKRSPRLEPGSFLLPPLSLVSLETRAVCGRGNVLQVSEPSRCKTSSVIDGKTKEGQGLAEGQMEDQWSSWRQDLDPLSLQIRS